MNKNGNYDELIQVAVDGLVFYGSATLGTNLTKLDKVDMMDVVIYLISSYINKTQYTSTQSTFWNNKENINIAIGYTVVASLIDAVKGNPKKILGSIVKGGSGLAGNMVIDRLLQKTDLAKYS